MPAGETLAPEPFPGRGDEATRDAVVGDDDEIISDDDGARDVGGADGVAPGDVGLRDIAAAVRANREDVLLREATGKKEELVLLVVDKGGDELLGRAVDDPELLTRVGIVARYRETALEQHLDAPVDLADDGGAVASRFVRAVRFQDRLAGFLIEGDEVGIAVVVAVDDDLAVPEDGT